ncbi:MAG: EVE domain-containing protein [Alphaproteobacteria bacterium]|jgi:predicted RNA-binding protein with PUA-like domain|nr:EVE domain-containing protein [Alphaproteobacteria bacterium]MDP7221775.1 EVE domain-containing protein [Alphaproteobacteria bacterium]
MAYWLVKSEPFKWSWEQQVEKGVEHWDGVRNYQASNNMKAMKIGDKAFFYHSNKGLEIVGIVEVVKEYYPDHTDPTERFGMVDFKAVKAMPNPVTLKQIKATPALSDMALVKQSRLSVSPVRDDEWDLICDMSGL